MSELDQHIAELSEDELRDIRQSLEPVYFDGELGAEGEHVYDAVCKEYGVRALNRIKEEYSNLFAAAEELVAAKACK